MNDYGGFSDALDDDVDTSGTLSDDYVEESLLHYARRHGLSHDFMTINPLAKENTPSSSTLSSLNLKIGSLTELEQPGDLINFEEKWHIDQRSAFFLRGVIDLDDTAEFPDISIKLHFSKAAKPEPPLLNTDANLDQRSFRRKWETRRKRYQKHPIDSFLWNEVDIATPLFWPGSDLPIEVLQVIKQERLQLSKDDILFLQQCASTQRENNEEDSYILLHSQSLATTAHQTPPLLSVSSPFALGIPDSPVCRIQLATSPEDPTVTHITRIEQNSDSEDVLAPDDMSKSAGFEDNYDHVFSILESSSATGDSSPLKRKRPEDLRIEVPLSPAPQSSPPMKRTKTVSFPDNLSITIPDYAKLFSSEDPQTVERRQSEFLENIIRPNAEVTIHAIANEQLKAVNSTMRMEIPSIDQSNPLAPWESFSRKRMNCQTELDSQQRLISMLKREMIKAYEAWPSVAKVDKVIKHWTPFNMRISDIPTEEIEANSLDLLVVKVSLHDATTLGWKPDGWRTLDVPEDDDDELDEAEIDIILDDTRSFDMGVSGFKMANGIRALNSTATHQPFVPHAIPQTNGLAFIESMQHNDLPQIKETRSILGGSFSASNSLDRFIQIHTGKAVVPKSLDQKEVHPKDTAINPSRAEPPAKVDEIEKPHEMPHCTQLPLPTIKFAVQPRWFMLSSTIFERRGLIRAVERLNPLASSIERDFTSIVTSRSLNAREPECEEADIIIAPSCGILITTLQKIKQRSLPGQVNRNLLRERILRLSRRYERLLVLVSEDRKDPPDASKIGSVGRPLDDRDCDEITSLVNFSSTQGHDIQVIYAPGDEAALATWIVSCMSRFGLDDDDFQLVQEETSWELFLRKAGMDAFAAQTILGKLKKPDPLPPDVDKMEHGLPAFIRMSQTERIRRFGGLMGEEKVLRRVSLAIDGRWTSAAPAGLNNSSAVR